MCNGKVARRAAIFARELCEAVLCGLRDELKAQRRVRAGEIGCVDECGLMIDGDDEVDMVLSVRADNGDHGVFLQSGSIAGSPPSADDDRRVGPAVTSQHKQGGPTKSKPGNGDIDSTGTDDLLKVGRHDRFVDDITASRCRRTSA